MRRSPSSLGPVLAVALVCFASCTGEIGGGQAGGLSGATDADGGPPADTRSGDVTSSLPLPPSPLPGGEPDNQRPAPDPTPTPDPTPDPEPTPDPPAPECSPATTACDDDSQCCEGFSCGETSLGQVCCGNEGAPCATANGEDCCGALLCVSGTCGFPPPEAACNGPCTEPPGLIIEKRRLADIGGSFLGICGDANHTYGYHVPASRLPASDYSLQGDANDPVCQFHAAAIDIGMDWPASRDWLRWLIREIRENRVTGIYEVIGSYDGVDVRYWSDDRGWETNGVDYTGAGHDTHTHVSIYRSTALDDHHILSGWTATGGP